MPLLVFGANEQIIRVAVIWETNEFSLAGSKYSSSFMDGFYFFSQQLAKKTWTAKLGEAVNYKMEMHTFDSKFDSNKIRVEFKDKIKAGQDEKGNVVGDFHFMIAATAKKNKDVMYVGEELGIPNIHASGGNPAMWWEHKEAAAAAGAKHTYAFGMHLPFIGYTKPIIKAAAASGYKTVAILRPHGNFFQQTSAVAAVQWALDEKLEIIGPSVKWCEKYATATSDPAAGKYTNTCRVVGGACRCIDAGEPVKLSKAEVTYDPSKIATVYEIDEKKVVPGLVKDHVYQEFVDVYKGVWDDVAEQMKARGQDFVDVIVHWPIQYKSSVRALKERDYKPSFFLGWNGGVGPTWSQGNFYNVTDAKTGAGVATTNEALKWTDGLHAFGFGQWFKTLTYSDPFFGTDVAGILKIWEADMQQGYGYDEFGACTTGIVLYLAVEKHLLKQDFVGQPLNVQRDSLRTAVLNVAEETLWGFVQWNKYQQNSGGGVSTTVAWQLQPRGKHWDVQPDASTLVLPEAFAEGPYVKKFATWGMRDGCSAVGNGSPWVVEAASPHAICRSCDNYGAESNSPGLFKSNADSTKCSLDVCPAGNYKLSAEQCISCAPGTYNNLVNQAKCTDCATGFFSPKAGGTSCQKCMDNSSTQRSGSAECVCVKGFFGQPGAGVACQKCPALMTTANMDSRTLGECVCEAGTYAVYDATGKVERCSKKFCGSGELVEVDHNGLPVTPYRNQGLTCVGHDDQGNAAPVVKAGFYIEPPAAAVAAVAPAVAAERRLAAVAIGEHSQIWKCLEEKYCPGGAVGTCGANRVGTTCVWCESDYRMNTDGDCEACGSTSPVIFGVSIAAVLLIMGLLRPMWNTNPLKQSTNFVVMVTALSIVGFVVMSILSLGTYSMQWKSPMKELMEVMDIFQFDLDLIRVQCVIENKSRVGFYVIKVIMPMLLMTFLTLLGIGNHKRKGTPIDWPVIVNTLGMLFSFFFVAIAVLSVEPLRCATKHPFGKSALDKKPDVVCSFDAPFGETYGAMVGLSIVALIFYVIIYLSLVGWAVFKHQSMVVSQNRFFIRSTRFLFFRWKNDCYFWTVFWHVRSLFVALVPIITAAGSGGGGDDSARGIFQIVILIAMFCLWGAEVSSQKPWRYSRLVLLDRFTTFTFVLMALGASYQSHESVQTFVTIAIIAMFTFIFGFIGREIYLAKFPSKASMVDFFISHNKQSAGLVARSLAKQLEYHSSGTVFLESDHQDNADAVNDANRTCKNFVVLWTDAIASDSACAVQIATAVHNKQSVYVMESDSVENGVDLGRLRQIEQDWTDEAKQEFDAAGLEPAAITDAYVSLKDAPRIQYSPTGGAGPREEAVQSLLQQSNSRQNKVPMLCGLPEGLDLFIAHDTNNSQSNAAAMVLKHHLRFNMNLQIATSADYTQEKFPATLLAKCPHAIVLLNNGVLADAQWTAAVTALDASCKITPVMVGMDFDFPSNDKLKSFEGGNLECNKELVGTYLKTNSIDCAQVAERLRVVFKSVSLPLSSAAGANIMAAEISNIEGRVRSGKRATTMQSVLGI